MEGVAIVGVAGRFPEAPDLDSFWANLRVGRECVHFYSDAELEALGLDGPALRAAGHVAARPRLDGVELFDASFFGYSPADAELIDPQQRIFLEACWEALENAGRNPRRAGGLVGVFAGQGVANYLIFNLGAAGRLEARRYFSTVVANGPDFLTSRVAHALGLTGPCVTVQTACSTALVAIHLACRSLLDFECDFALAGGVNLQTIPVPGHFYDGASMLSPDGHTRVFDARAGGTIFGEGAGAVVLRRLEDAVRDGDTIHAVIRGTAVNNSGKVPAGFAAPDPRAQEEVAAEALANAGVAADSVSYLEAHGTGSPIGDAIELTALNRAFRRTARGAGFCRIGAVKSNLGHLSIASGIASLCKTLLALRHRQIPPTILVETPHPDLPLAGSPFRLARGLEEWSGPTPRRAGVHSYGIGGANAHLVLEEGPQPSRSAQGGGWHLLPLSARTSTALAAAARRLAEHLRATPEVGLADAARTLMSGREEYRHRLFVVCRERAEAAALLERPREGRSGRGAADPTDAPPLRPERAAATAEALAAVGEEWVRGRRVEWSTLEDPSARRVPLPSYPFERARCWVDLPRPWAGGAAVAGPGAAGSREPSAELERSPAPAPPRTDLDRRVCAVWREVLGGGREVGIDDNFFELGGTSLQLAEVHARLRAALSPDVSVVDVFAHPTVRGLVDRLGAAPGGGIRPGTSGLDPGRERLDGREIEELRADARLAEEVRPPTIATPEREPDAVLLTGATGFLGAFLLRELVRQTRARVYCHVRASSPAAGRERIRAALSAQRLEEDVEAERIVPVCGDLAEPRLGLSVEAHAELASSVGAVYHNGALVNFTHPYSKLRAANVGGTEQALRLACSGRPKAFHFVSTVGVWAGRFPVAEDDPLEEIAGLENGYTQSKWVAERLVQAAAERGLPACIYRPPRVVGDTRGGFTNLDDFVARVIKGCVELGLAPTGHFFDIMAPVDYVARAVVYLSRQPASYARRTFHLAHPRLLTWRTILDYMEEIGLGVRFVPYAEWRESLVARCQAHENALKPLLPLFRPQTAEAPAQPPPDATIPWEELPRVRCENAEAGLAGSGIACPEIDRPLLDVYFRYFFQSGFLERPGVESRR